MGQQSNSTLEYTQKRFEIKDRNLHTMCVAALFIIAKIQNSLKCSSLDEWVSQVCYIQRMEYYSVKKRNEILIHATT
jgi:hypothetical protein